MMKDFDSSFIMSAMEKQEGRIVEPEKNVTDDVENILRPKAMEGYIGQEKAKQNLAVFIESAKMRGETLDHVLLYGPPGLGKTTLAHIIANEMDSHIKVTSGPAIERAGDLIAILTGLNDGDILFIDEIHRLNRNIEEVLYPAMEDYAVDYITGKGPMAASIRMTLKKFTIVGATTRAGLLSSPLRDRFGVILRLEMYTPEELAKIIKRSSEILNMRITDEGAMELGKRSRGTPRIANRLLKRVRDFSIVLGHDSITLQDTKEALQKLDIDGLGLDNTDIRLLTSMAQNFGGGPVGLDTLAATINEDGVTIEDVYEPYLMQLGFIARTPRGRMLTDKAYKHLGIKRPQQAQVSFFEDNNVKD